MTPKVIEWHRLIDGDPPETGRYIVGHRAGQHQVNYRRGHGWTEDVSHWTHWAKEPCAPDDGTPTLRSQEGRSARRATDEWNAWHALYNA